MAMSERGSICYRLGNFIYDYVYVMMNLTRWFKVYFLYDDCVCMSHDTFLYESKYSWIR